MDEDALYWMEGELYTYEQLCDVVWDDTGGMSSEERAELDIGHVVYELLEWGRIDMMDEDALYRMDGKDYTYAGMWDEVRKSVANLPTDERAGMDLNEVVIDYFNSGRIEIVDETEDGDPADEA